MENNKVEYHGYFVVAANVWRLGNAWQRTLCPSEFYSATAIHPAVATPISSSSSSPPANASSVTAKTE
jgi:hypothetical protein